MLALKLIFIPLFIIFYAAGKIALKKYGSVTADRAAGRKINLAVFSIFILCVALAAFIRLTFDIELMLPQIIRIHATHFKWFGIEVLFACMIGFAAGLYSREPLNIKRKLYITAAILSVMILYFEFFYTRPIYAVCKDRLKDGFVMQSFQSTCGPSALANLFIIHGVKISESEAARAARTRYTGTTGDELAIAAAALNKNYYAHYFKMAFEDIEKIDLPCVLSFNEEHFVTYSGKRRHLCEYIDPSIGICLAKKEDLIKEWDNKALYIYPKDFAFSLKKGGSDERLINIKIALSEIYSDKSGREKKTAAAGAEPEAASYYNEVYDGVYDDSLETMLTRFAGDYDIKRRATEEIDPYINLAIFSKADRLKKETTR
jgi:predicted double-glycine peptidase